MYNVVDEVEARADDLPLRRIKALDLDHITLVVKKQPVYSATSVEVRAEGEVNVETRSVELAVTGGLDYNADYRKRYEDIKR